MALKLGICQLCMNPRELALSHAIPDALIRAIKRRNNGQTISILDRPPYFQRSNESGGDHLLCEPCETRLNQEFDAYGVGRINEARKKLDRIPREIRLEVDPQRMLGFLASVLWRASISTNPVYNSIETEYGERMQLRRIFETKSDRYVLASMSISNLIDGRKHFSDAALRDVVVPPTDWNAISPGRKLRSFFFIANGLLFNLTMPPPGQGTVQSTFWTADSIRPRMSDQDIRTFPPVLRMLGLPTRRK